MRKKFRRSASRAAKFSPKFSGWAIILSLVIIACHRFGVMNSATFIKIMLAMAALALIGVALAIKGFHDLWQRGDKGGRSSIKGMIYALITLVPLGFIGGMGLMLPYLHDISSDLEDPPVYPVTIRPAAALSTIDMMKNADLQREAWPDLRGRIYEVSPDGIIIAIEAVLAAQGWQKQLQINGEGTDNSDIFVTAIADMAVLGFVSDVLIRIRDREEATFVDMRVTIRDLTHDFGFGAYSINSFMHNLDQEVLLSAIENRQEN